MLSCEYWELFKYTYSAEYLRMAAPKYLRVKKKRMTNYYAELKITVLENLEIIWKTNKDREYLTYLR